MWDWTVGCPKSAYFGGHVTIKLRRGAYIILHNHTKHACIVLAPYDKVNAGARTKKIYLFVWILLCFCKTVNFNNMPQYLQELKFVCLLGPQCIIISRWGQKYIPVAFSWSLELSYTWSLDTEALQACSVGCLNLCRHLTVYYSIPLTFHSRDSGWNQTPKNVPTSWVKNQGNWIKDTWKISGDIKYCETPCTIPLF